MTGEVCPDGIIPLKRRHLQPNLEPMTRGLHRLSVIVPSPGRSTIAILIGGAESRLNSKDNELNMKIMQVYYLLHTHIRVHII